MAIVNSATIIMSVQMISWQNAHFESFMYKPKGDTTVMVVLFLVFEETPRLVFMTLE